MQVNITHKYVNLFVLPELIKVNYLAETVKTQFSLLFLSPLFHTLLRLIFQSGYLLLIADHFYGL